MSAADDAQRGHHARPRNPAEDAGPANRSTAKRTGPANRSTAEDTAPANRSTAKRTAPANRSPAEDTAPANRSTAKRTGPADRSPAEDTAPANRSTAEDSAPANRSKAKRTGRADRSPADGSTADSTGAADGMTGRRTFLAGIGAAAVAGLGGACTADGTTGAGSDGSDTAGTGTGGTGTQTDGVETDGAQTAPAPSSEPVPFRSERQLGVLRPPSAAGLVVAFDVAVSRHPELVETLQQLSAEIERLMAGTPLDPVDEFLPPPDSGILGPDLSGSLGPVAITVGVGASVFDQRFGLAERAPSELIVMPRFFNDRLVRPEQSHGDLVVLITADRQHGAVHALHQLVRVAGDRLALRWVQEGYNNLLPPEPGRIAPARNLMGFRDGTSNPDTADGAAMNDHVWVQPGDDEPDWVTGGTYLAVRVIRMLIEFWSTAALVRQEQIFGRHRDSGAPLGQENEGDEPAFAADPGGETIPLRSHMRLANPRTPGTGLILRRGFSYLNGTDSGGTLDQGLLFLAFQRSMSNGFLSVQSRLEGEPLEDYIKPVGGGFFFILPGPGDDGWLGQSMLA